MVTVTYIPTTQVSKHTGFGTWFPVFPMQSKHNKIYKLIKEGGKQHC